MEQGVFDRDAQSNQSGQAKGTGDDQQWNQQFRSLSGDSREGGGKESHDFFSCSRFQVAVLLGYPEHVFHTRNKFHVFN